MRVLSTPLLASLIFSVDHLLDADGEGTIESKHNLFRFYNYVKSLLPSADINVMRAASKTLGKIAEIGGAAFGEHFMDYEVQTAIEMLQADKQEPGRYAGVLILKELARNSPTYFHSHIGLVFEKILVPLRDTRIIVRESAAELLKKTTEIIFHSAGAGVYRPIGYWTIESYQEILKLWSSETEEG